ncbi:MAG TPA: hypothetical protein VFC44_11420 [Candidatus Saccharimonadales bacterium]|nr:hypothetical protein [Candidatus Saccharimonadales bacterium]
MKISWIQRLSLGATVWWAAALPCPAAPIPSPLQDAVVLVIRHAEKPESGAELTAAGFQRADDYAAYFKTFQIDGQAVKLDHLFAARDSKNSHRPRLTLTPLGRALNLPLDTRFKDKDFQELADALRSKPQGANMLICWHHTAIPDLLTALGADPATLLPGGKWPASVFNWVIELRYGHDGQLRIEACKRIEEPLLR